MTDMLDQLDRTHRELSSRETEHGSQRSVLLRRTFDTDIEDVWDACTDADRIARWLGPVSGDLRLGGRYQIEGNAGGEIQRCEPPKLLRVSWIYGEESPTNTSVVEVRLATASPTATAFELEHMAVDIDPQHWQQFGPGAVGIGWDLALFGLAAHLAGSSVTAAEDAELLQTTEAKEFMTAAGRAWGAAHETAGASAAEASGAVDRTLAAYTGEASPTDS